MSAGSDANGRFDAGVAPVASGLTPLATVGPMLQRILFVDDEPHLLDGIARGLRKRFDIHTATGGLEGLRVLQEMEPFAVVVSDMRMPEMNGVQFLSRARDLYPDTVRIILSGQADMTATIAAVNEGNIFRFLSKPCDTQELLAAVTMGVEQYHLLRSERVLLEQTLSGAVKMLIEVLSIVMPAASARAQRLQQYVIALASALELREHWQWPLAALLSQVGCVSLPKDTLSKVEAGEQLEAEEQQLYDSHPQVAAQMLEAIPRLEDVAAIVGAQSSMLDGGDIPEAASEWSVRCAGKILLRAASEFDRQTSQGHRALNMAEALRAANIGLPEKVIEATAALVAGKQGHVMRNVRLLDLAVGMRLDEALMTHKGACLVPSGVEVTPMLLIRLRGLAANVQIQEPFRVQVLV
jgi:response regulator RpfG family c-di-GMP phosphodiesterase